MKSVRVTASLPEEQHEQLQDLAEKNSLSVAWLVRQAVGDFLDKIDDSQNYNPLTKETAQGDR
ncbi:ribbon-helix-helix domain-containing protein [uncultured Cocleimonas sp.]|uniref:ribbon-helix-helix domain-containing protein n=1 Tax=uncultured Cocleimonas sp. TaxID=1051587 RepID=UPI00260492ED|nr:ribbon-helix-helix domain-containing protein [uncultured Cocleimonas sp.]